MAPPKPFDLRSGVTVNDIAFVILEIPRDDDQDIPFTDPDFLFDLPLGQSHAGHTVKTPDTDMVCVHHQLGAPELFTVWVSGQSYPDDLVAGFGAMDFFIRQEHVSPFIAVQSGMHFF
jgi:hypothetical protein